MDRRFEGTAVGVGSGKILGRIHIANLKISGHFFPCSITVMDSDKGLGDKNMDFLFGLDMLKRHRCTIDLAKNALVFTVGESSQALVAPFLHEHELDVSKGVTRGFDPATEGTEAEPRISNSSGGRSSSSIDMDVVHGDGAAVSSSPSSAAEPSHQFAQPPAAAAASPAGNINFNFSAMPSAEVGDGAQSESGDGAATVAMVDFQAMVGQLVSQGMDMTTAAATALQQIAALQQQRQNQ